MNETYSLAQIAKILGRPSTTVVTWKDRFIEFIPIIDGPKPRYPELALEIFKAIHVGYTKGLETDQIKAKLQQKYAITITDESPTNDQDIELTTTQPPTNKLIEQNKVLLQAMGLLREELTELRQEVSTIRQSNENIYTNTNTLIDENKSLKTEIKAQNEWAVHTLQDMWKEKEKKKNWIEKIFGS